MTGTGIFGAGGFGREVLPEVRKIRPESEIVFVEDNPPEDLYINGIRVITLEVAIREKRDIVLAVGDWRLRKKVSDICEYNNIPLLCVVAQDAVIYDSNNIGVGAVICSGSIITSNTRIGKGFQCNLMSYVAHDCVIGDYVTLAPRVSCNGRVVIGDGAYIGTGAVIREGTSIKPILIGQGSTVGMGAVVTKDVPPNCTVVGNPARILDK